MTETTIAEFRPATVRWMFGSLAGWATLACCLVLVGLPYLLAIALQNVTTKYTLTSQRLIIKKGIIFRHVDEIELYRVKDLKVRYSLLNAMVGIGQITVASSDPSTRWAAMVLDDVPNAVECRQMMRDAVEEIRRVRGVREVDRGHIDQELDPA